MIPFQKAGATSVIQPPKVFALSINQELVFPRSGRVMYSLSALNLFSSLT